MICFDYFYYLNCFIHLYLYSVLDSDITMIFFLINIKVEHLIKIWIFLILEY